MGIIMPNAEAHPPAPTKNLENNSINIKHQQLVCQLLNADMMTS